VVAQSHDDIDISRGDMIVEPGQHARFVAGR
jgi:sulfate adenylyltransferase subunit 1 (EFTu-like GTPase family)